MGYYGVNNKAKDGEGKRGGEGEVVPTEEHAIDGGQPEVNVGNNCNRAVENSSGGGKLDHVRLLFAFYCFVSLSICFFSQNIYNCVKEREWQ